MRHVGCVCVITVLIALAGCGEKPAPRAESPRPVVVVELKNAAPGSALRLTGVAEAWSEEDIAFEVAGRMNFIVEAGTYLRGRWMEDGKVIQKGDRLAALDDSSYRSIKQGAEADVEYATIQLEKVLPAALRKAKAEETRAQIDFDSQKKLRERNAGSELEFLNAQATYESARAQVQQVEAEIQGAKAQLSKAQSAVQRATLDLERTTLYAPFTGEVAELNARAGAFVNVGQPVAKLVMLDPMKVRVMISAEMNERIGPDEPITVHTPNAAQPIYGKVYQKATVADPQTRTFPLTLICRNRKVVVPADADEAMLKLPRIDRVLPVLRENIGEDGPLFVEERLALRKDDEGFFVWLLDGISIRSGVPKRPVFTVKKVRVKPGEQRRNYQRVFVLRELIDAGGLRQDQLLAAGVPDGVKDGDQVALIRTEWIMHPGGLLGITFEKQHPGAGIYVPMQAVLPTSEGKGAVFIVVDGKAKRVEVDVKRSENELRQIAGDSVEPGVKVVVDGAAYLKDGEPVSVTRVLESN